MRLCAVTDDGNGGQNAYYFVSKICLRSPGFSANKKRQCIVRV
ncbi:hypothetical protein AVDCRST_MAG94-654 [uncultured Leptolyngbya sp.]|uniref:Uncharacterized protein n=1 Tax=uncultured Leptolyngbya sp. TaxID=332963 RepID=A0A6J4KI77_9CYAN|nr:hypothetical protein AVDCRST_MAG94-654 [uncultured Leptolyngbya sp.]